MRNPLLLLLATLGLLFAACCNTPQARMRAADAIIEADPDSALALLHAIDPADLTSASDSAYYALLLTQARIKTDTQPASDTLISRALAAYRFSPDPSLRTRAHFYAAKVAYRDGDYKSAMKNATIAYDISQNCSDPYWIAKSAEVLGDIYGEVYNEVQSARYTKIAAENYLRAGKIRSHRFALCDLATHFSNRGLFDSAYMVVDSVILLAQSECPIDSALLSYARRVLIGIQWVSGDYAALSESIKNYENTESVAAEKLTYSVIESYAASTQGDSASFTNLLTAAYVLADNEKDLLQVVYAEYCDAVANENYKAALQLADSIINLQNTVADALLEESVATIQSDYYQSQKDLQSQKNEFLHQLLLVLVICATIIIILLVSLYTIKLRAARVALQANITSMQLLKATSTSKEQLIESLAKSKWSIVNKLCNAYFDLSESPVLIKFVVQSIETELQELRSKDSISDILSATDNITQGLISQLKSECTFLKSSDIEFIGLIYAGLSVRAVCYLTGIKKDYYYKKKNRLLQRIEASDAKSKAAFIARLSEFVA
ncbi:MAG: hypothetical protein HDR46_04885 [Bacteroides sp.]|nr:hypothetical protein [Bacteroides sp.]